MCDEHESLRGGAGVGTGVGGGGGRGVTVVGARVDGAGVDGRGVGGVGVVTPPEGEAVVSGAAGVVLVSLLRLLVGARDEGGDDGAEVGAGVVHAQLGHAPTTESEPGGQSFATLHGRKQSGATPEKPRAQVEQPVSRSYIVGHKLHC